MQKIRDIMTSSPKTCQVDHPVTCSLQIMKDENCGAVPVLDEKQKVIGMITDRDIALCLLDHQNPIHELHVQDCVKNLGRVVTVKQDDEIHRAIELMEQNQVRRIPVVDDQMKLVGIVSQADIALRDQNKQEVVQMVQEISKEKQSIGSNP